MGWIERAASAIGRGLIKIAVALLALGIVIGVWVYLGNNQRTFNRVVQSSGDFSSTALTSSLDWATAKMGGSAATAQGATAGPETVWVESKAPASWHVRQAVATWNRGLTTVRLRIGACQDGTPCIHVSEVSYLAPIDGRLTLGKTSSFFGSSPSVKFNRAAIGQVPASFFQVAACHELGHALGAQHNPSKGSCMHATIGVGVPARPDRPDFVAVNAKYGR